MRRLRPLSRFILYTFLSTALLVFSADAQAANEAKVRFAVISDIHIHKYNIAVHQRLKRALRDYWQINPHMDFIAINGDLTNGFPSHYETLRRLLAETPHPPLHFTPGNHEFNKMLYNGRGKFDFDHLPNGWSSEQAMALFKNFTGYEKPYHDAWVNGYHFIFMADEKSRDVDRSIDKHGYISQQQFAWLEKKLREGEAGEHKPTFVFFHQPLPNTLSGSEKDVNIIQYKELRRILNRYPETILFSGHTHYSLRKTNQKHFDQFLMLGSSSIKFNEESLYIEVYDNYIDIHSRDHRRGEWISGKSFRYRP